MACCKEQADMKNTQSTLYITTNKSIAQNTARNDRYVICDTWIWFSDDFLYMYCKHLRFDFNNLIHKCINHYA